MNTQLLELPFTNIQVMVNDKPITFEYQNLSNNKFCYGDEEVSALGAIEISINPKMFQPDDIIFIKSSAGKLENDGGDEGTINEVAKLESYTYGIGGPDTEFIEWVLGNIPGNYPDSVEFGYDQQTLNYELINILEEGLKYKVIEGVGSEKYTNGKLVIPIVWESNSKKYAYDIVSFLTC